MKVDGARWRWLEADGAGWRWMHGLVIPILQVELEYADELQKLHNKYPFMLCCFIRYVM